MTDRIRGVWLFGGVLVFAAATTAADKVDTSVIKRLNTSTAVFEQMVGTPSTGIPDSLVQCAQCVAVIPHIKRGAVVVGARYGAGFASCRNASGGWSAPAPVQISGGSIGAQIGFEENDMVLLLMSPNARNQLVANKLKFGATASAQAGPVGAGAASNAAAGVPDAYSYTSKNGIFAGASINGMDLQQDDGTTKDLYGRDVPTASILSGSVPPPPQAQPFLSALEKYPARR